MRIFVQFNAQKMRIDSKFLSFSVPLRALCFTFFANIFLIISYIMRTNCFTNLRFSGGGN